MSNQPLGGRVAAITGGTRGIGRATAAAFVREGIRVAIGGRDVEAAERVAAELGHGTIGLPLEVTDRSSVASFLDTTEKQLGPLDILVNNAGIMLIGPPLWEEDDLTAQRQIDVNINGVLHGIKEAVPRLRLRGRGHIVNVASGAGKVGYAGGATYCGSKHFVIGASEALRAELRGTGVDVTCVIPGIVNTELAAGHRPLKGLRVVEAEDVANGIVSALRHPRFEVTVPPEVDLVGRARALLPRFAFDLLLRLTGADTVLSGTDPAARVAYETHAATTSVDATGPTTP